MMEQDHLQHLNYLLQLPMVQPNMVVQFQRSHLIRMKWTQHVLRLLREFKPLKALEHNPYWLLMRKQRWKDLWEQIPQHVWKSFVQK